MKTYNYWQGVRGTLIVCSDGRFADTVFGEAMDSRGNIVGAPDYISIHDKLMDELWSKKNRGRTDSSLIIDAANHVPCDIIDTHGSIDDAIWAYVGETI